MSAKKLEKYGLLWMEATHPLRIEFQMIEAGGTYTRSDGVVAGNGLAWHWKRAQEILWPDHPSVDVRKKWHKWNEMQSECYVKHRTIVVLGPASSGKTCSAATDALLDYYLYPSKTTIIICSTTRERLEERIWGEIKKYHRAAKERVPWLAGHLIEGRLRLVTDPRSKAEEGRDFRNGVLGVACFCAGTLVDTPFGPAPIENLKVGDAVVNAGGIGRITETHVRQAQQLIRVHLVDGRKIDCTPEHPFFTERGWINAVDLTTSDMVFSSHETMRLMRDGHQQSLSEPEILHGVFGSRTGEALPLLRQVVATVESNRPALSTQVLQPCLRESMGGREHETLDTHERLRPLRQGYTQYTFQSELLFCEMSQSSASLALPRMRQVFRFDSGIPGKTSDEVLRDILQEESYWSGDIASWADSHTRGVCGKPVVLRCNRTLLHSDGTEMPSGTGPSVSNRHCISGAQVSGRNRRWNTHDARTPQAGPEAHLYSPRTRVDRVEILEQRCDARFAESRGGYQVHNLEVDGHPSYSVQGVIVHNCLRGSTSEGLGSFVGIKNKRVRLIVDELSLLPRVIIDAISNLDKNPDFKCVGLGNPKETTDALGILAEPAVEMGGWDSGIDQKPVTKTWPTRRPDGICLQLVGSDSPNLDGTLGIPLITQEQIDRDIAFYGKDSLQFTMMNQGMMPRGQGTQRVLTRALCQKFRAFDEPVWRDSVIKKIAFMDAGYGGDRCIFGELQFGLPAEANVSDVAMIGGLAQQTPASHMNRQILALVDTVLVPVSAEKEADLPEDQIVRFVVEQLTKRGIPMEDFFYEPGMRTKLTVAFARITGKTGNPVDSGGKATERPVAHGIDVKCCDYYFNFITEQWWAVRLAVESGQFRGMKESVLAELCAREWKYAASQKIQVETKAEMKRKTGRSPDEADALVCGLEGARQRGFEIVKAVSKTQAKTPGQSERWKSDAREKAKGAWQAGQLNYAA
jgi:hypothetical protein